MSRNLGTSDCPHCGRTVTLNDVVGRTIEARSYRGTGNDPVIGVRIVCPGTVEEPFWPDGDDRVSVSKVDCRTDLYVWLGGDNHSWLASGNVDLSYGRSFNDEPWCYACMDRVPVGSSYPMCSEPKCRSLDAVLAHMCPPGSFARPYPDR